MRLISRNAGFGYTLTTTKAPLASAGTVTSTTLVDNIIDTYSYEWFETNAAGTISSTTGDYDLTLSGLIPVGTAYYMLRTTSNGCSIDSDVIQITGPTAIGLQISAPLCDDEIQAVASGGTGSYQYQLYTRTGKLLVQNDSGLFVHGMGGIEGPVTISGGMRFQVGVTDTNGCTFDNPNDATIEVIMPNQLFIDSSTILATNPGCAGNDGSITLNNGGTTITGGSAGLTGDYSNYDFEWTGPGGVVGNTQFIWTFWGDYFVTVTDKTCSDLSAVSELIEYLQYLRLLQLRQLLIIQHWLIVLMDI